MHQCELSAFSCRKESHSALIVKLRKMKLRTAFTSIPEEWPKRLEIVTADTVPVVVWRAKAHPPQAQTSRPVERAFKLRAALTIAMVLLPMAARVDGPFGIGHTVPLDNSRIWAPHNQKTLEGVTILTVVGGSLALDDQDRLRDTFWRSLDLLAVFR